MFHQILTIVGPYRYHNFGDDLMGAVLVKSLQIYGFRKVYLPLLSSDNCRWLKIVESENINTALKKSNFVVIGGGGILGDSGITPDNYYLKLALKTAIYSKFYNKKIAITGVGAGPLKLLSSRNFVRFLSLLVNKIGVRDLESLTFLKSLGIKKKKIVSGADIALLWQDFFQFKKLLTNKIGVQYDVDSFCDKDKTKIDMVKTSLNKFINKKINDILLITNGPSKSQLTGKKEGSIKQLNYVFLPDFLKELIGIRVILTSHLHLSIAAYAARIPCFSIYVREKTKRFYDQIGRPERALNIDEANSRNINNLLSELKKARWTKYDERNLEILKKKANRLLDFKQLFY